MSIFQIINIIIITKKRRKKRRKMLSKHQYADIIIFVREEDEVHSNEKKFLYIRNVPVKEALIYFY